MIVDVQGRRIGCDVRGEGPAVLLLHPFPFDRRFWANVTDDVARPGFRVVTMDCRGFGESSFTGEHTIDDLADDAIALLDRLGVPMAAIVGCSMGGYVALSIAARHPARLSALVLAGSRAGADGDAAHANRIAAAREIREHGPRAFLDGTAVRLCGRSASEDVRTEVQTLAESSAPELARALPITLLALGSRVDRTALLPTLRVPTLVIVGEEDAVTPPDEARAMKRAIPGAELVELPRAGHLPSREVPEAFLRALRAFLEPTLAAS